MMSDNTEMQPRGYFILGLQLIIIILNIRRHVMVTVTVTVMPSVPGVGGWSL